MALHSSLTDPNLHEPKGVSTATSGQVYVANGSGSGAWTARLPSMSGKSGYLLTNNGTNESWSSDSSVRARCTVTMSGTTPSLETGSVNCASITRTSAGIYKLTFTTALASTNYQPFVSIMNAAGAVGCNPITRLTTELTMGFYVYTGGTFDPTDRFNIIIFGGF